MNSALRKWFLRPCLAGDIVAISKSEKTRAAMPILRILGLMLLTLFVLVGCETVHDGPSAGLSAATTHQVRNEGCSLLYELLGKERHVNRVLLIKKETPELGDLIDEITRHAGDAAEQLKEFAKTDPTLDLNQAGLPLAERKARSSIESAHTKELLTSSGREFELRLLIAQAEALTYGRHLAKVLAERDNDVRRRLFFENLSHHFEALHQKVMNLLSVRIKTN